MLADKLRYRKLTWAPPRNGKFPLTHFSSTDEVATPELDSVILRSSIREDGAQQHLILKDISASMVQIADKRTPHQFVNTKMEAMYASSSYEVS